VVTAGLNPGDKVIVQGVGQGEAQRRVKPVPADRPQRIGRPSPDGKHRRPAKPKTKVAG
jgi:membrane fusion protein (multidrug efflux system)